MNRVQLSVFLIIIILGACGKHKKQKDSNGKEFEGVITYLVEYENVTPQWPIDADTLTVTYSHGNALKSFNSRKPRSLCREIYLSKCNQYYFNRIGSDTLYKVNLAKNKHVKLLNISHSLTDTCILGHVCELTSLEFMVEKNGHFNHVYNVFFYSKGVLTIDKNSFKDCEFAYFNKFIEESGSFYLRMEARYESSTAKTPSRMILRAIRIQESRVDPTIFAVDTTNVHEIEY